MLKLSEAIRLGATLHPQATGVYAVGNAHGEVLATCALGAALVAIGQNPMIASELDDIPAEWIPPGGFLCPACLYGDYSNHLDNMVGHLNDDHHWTREQIADWVETVEQEHRPVEQSELEEQFT